MISSTKQKLLKETEDDLSLQHARYTSTNLSSEGINGSLSNHLRLMSRRWENGLQQE